MQNYKRKITYFYQYHNGNVGSTAGFLKLEIRGEKVKIIINIQEPSGLPYKEASLCFYHEAGDHLAAIKVDQIENINGVLTYQTRTDWQQLFHTGRDLYTFDGVAVVYNDSHYYIGDFQDRNRKDYALVVKEQKQNREPVIENGEVESRAEEKEYSGNRETKLLRIVEENSESREPKVSDLKDRKEGMATNSIRIEHCENSEADCGNQQGSLKNHSETELENRQASPRNNSETDYRKEQGSSNRILKADYKNEQGSLNRILKEDCRNQQGSLSRISETKYQHGNSGGNTELKGDYFSKKEVDNGQLKKILKNNTIKEENSSRSMADQNGSDCEHNEKKTCKNQRNDIYEKCDDCPYYKKRNEQKEYADAFDKMLEEYPKLPMYGATELFDCVRIHPRDIGKLDMRNWKLGVNSFLTHGYYTYQYLLLGKMRFDNGSEQAIIGVPGVFSNREKYLANMFGFEQFIPVKKTGIKTGEFGYWIVEISPYL